jgi:hypothetical protein
MSVIVTPKGGKPGKGQKGGNELLVKGAPESVVVRCTHALLANGNVIPMTAAMRTTLIKKVCPTHREKLEPNHLSHPNGWILCFLEAFIPVLSLCETLLLLFVFFSHITACIEPGGNCE